MDKIKSVIYKITNKVNSKIYVGSTVNWKARKQEHFRDLELKKHHSIALQRAYDLYGKENFVFEIIEAVEIKSNLIQREQFYIDQLSPEYNCCKIAGSVLGRKMTEAQNLSNSFRNRGEKNSNSKIKETDIPDIFKLRSSKTVGSIAKIYNVHHSTIQRVLNKRSFCHLNYEIKKFDKKYSKEIRAKISEDAKKRTNSAKIILDTNTGVYYNSITELSNLLGINNSTLKDRIDLKYNPLPNYLIV